MNKKELNVMITTRDRSIITKKAIESLIENKSIFTNINIYLYDNLSEFNTERFELISYLLNNKMIKYYSYDTEESINKCFPKISAHERFYNMMNTKLQLYDIRPIHINDKPTDFYFLIMDDDIIVSNNWEKAFIETADIIESYESNIHYICQFRGGTPPRIEQLGKWNIINNYEILFSEGGSSCFWFMNRNMFTKNNWCIEKMNKSTNKFKKHDSLIWESLKEKGYKHFCASIKPKDDPFIIHLGDEIGSLCKSLNANNYNNNVKQEFLNSENRFKDLSHFEIYEKFKKTCNNW